MHFPSEKMNQRTSLHGDSTINTGKSERTMIEKCPIFFWVIPSCRENVSPSVCTILFLLTRGRQRAEREEESPLTIDLAVARVVVLWKIDLPHCTRFFFDLARGDREKRDERLWSQIQVSAKPVRNARGLPSRLQLYLLEWSRLPQVKKL